MKEILQIITKDWMKIDLYFWSMLQIKNAQDTSRLIYLNG